MMRVRPAEAGIARRIASRHRGLIAPEARGVRAKDLPRTVVACSGGADSCALAIALASKRFPLVIAHIVHDMRPEPEALADRDVARRLSAELGVPFVESRVRISTKGNAEASARRSRYAALARLAGESDCRFIATAHHADDQLETMVMALVRGTGIRGLRGIAEMRPVPGGITIVRPMLGVTHAEAEALCRSASVVWAEDRTNADTSRFRAALRHGPVAELTRLRPAGPLHAARTAGMVRDLAVLLESAIDAVPTLDDHRWSRAVLRGAPAIVIGGLLRRAFLEATSGKGADALSARMVDAAAAVIRSPGTDPKVVQWPRGVRVRVTAHAVSIERHPD